MYDKVKVCPNGHVETRMSYFCSECGEEVSFKNVEHIMVCPICGRLFADSDYCDECGVTLDLLM